MPISAAPVAVMGGWVATDLDEVTSDPAVLDRSGRWAVAVTFEGRATFARFRTWERRDPTPDDFGEWLPPTPGGWRSTLDERGYRAAVEAVRARISRGEVYQANICRVLRTAVDPRCDIVALLARLVVGNPAPHAGALRLPEHGIHIASASPELYLRRDGAVVESRPIKGTGAHAVDLRPKDEAENVMIVDLVRNDLGRVCRTGSVTVPELLAVEPHPGLVHLVSSVAGELRDGVGWEELLAATFPPGSVTGAPKIAALDIIRELELGPRGPYCGAFGWVDADTKRAALAVAIRTFWLEGTESGLDLAFGTGAGITWASDPGAEWRETELKSARLLQVAGGGEVS
jgi:para-aminobenzoate synthetase component 1